LRGNARKRAIPRRSLGRQRQNNVIMINWPVSTRDMRVTPHVAQYPETDRRGSAIDARTTRHAGYEISQRKRKLVEQAFGWMKTIGPLRKLHHRGGLLVNWNFTFAAATYNLVRLRSLLAQPV
jgi:hypothetical protein